MKKTLSIQSLIQNALTMYQIHLASIRNANTKRMTALYSAAMWKLFIGTSKEVSVLNPTCHASWSPSGHQNKPAHSHSWCPSSPPTCPSGKCALLPSSWQPQHVSSCEGTSCRPSAQRARKFLALLNNRDLLANQVLASASNSRALLLQHLPGVLLLEALVYSRDKFFTYFTCSQPPRFLGSP